jgi:hypothetical protein
VRPSSFGLSFLALLGLLRLFVVHHHFFLIGWSDIIVLEGSVEEEGGEGEDHGAPEEVAEDVHAVALVVVVIIVVASSELDVSDLDLDFLLVTRIIGAWVLRRFLGPNIDNGPEDQNNGGSEDQPSTEFEGSSSSRRVFAEPGRDEYESRKENEEDEKSNKWVPEREVLVGELGANVGEDEDTQHPEEDTIDSEGSRELAAAAVQFLFFFLLIILFVGLFGLGGLLVSALIL